ncbi:hypothetical protein M8J76_002190 [Diaphorina citri]|nr:hypothetical protein M8J75_013832 [Diaphorina citri]KAI5736329.1 hypothetical protein M8J76_002190 [Diaphorina citri]KAI5743688.1 hypothetical protein M8J77_021102 [Diaphorina citri]
MSSNFILLCSVTEIENLNSQLDQLHSALDTLEEKNDNIKERLLELLQIVKVNRDQLDEVESNLSNDISATNNSELSSLREQLSQMEACMANVMLPQTSTGSTASLREQLHQLEINVSQAADLGNNIMSNTEEETD